MLRAEKRARKSGQVIAPGAKPMTSSEATDLAPDHDVKLCVWNAIIPVSTLIIGAFVGFYLNGRASILSGADAALIQLFKDAPLGFTAVREAFGASDASSVLFHAAMFAGVVAIAMEWADGFLPWKRRFRSGSKG